jgi:hypothetical protein
MLNAFMRQRVIVEDRRWLPNLQYPTRIEDTITNSPGNDTDVVTVLHVMGPLFLSTTIDEELLAYDY